MLRNRVKCKSLKAECCSNCFEDECVKIKVVGIINTSAFQKARICAEKLHQYIEFKFAKPEIIEMFQIEWHEYLEKTKRQIGGKMWSLTRTVAIFINNEFLGNDIEFFHYISQDYILSLPLEIGYYENIAIERCKQFMNKSKRTYVYFTFGMNNHAIGSFVFMLYSDLLPLTCQHFLNLCNGYDAAKQCYRNVYYINTYVHRIVKNGWIQCGDIEQSENNGDRLDDVSIISDESYCIPHDRRGVLSMANDGKHCNQFQFVVCLKPNPWMNHYYVAFGQLIDGARTLKTLENVSTYYEHPIAKIRIVQCGEYFIGDEPKMETESQVFFEHRSTIVEGEDTKINDSIFDFYSITPWLDNIVDAIDVRDRASIVMAERYLNSLHRLSTDHEPGVDIGVYGNNNVFSITKHDTTAIKLHHLLINFHPDAMTELEKLTFVSEISNIILAYIFYHEHNEFCLQHISMNTRVTVQKVLEIAHKIAEKVIEKAGRSNLILLDCNNLDIARIFRTGTEDVLPSENCMSLLQDILNKAILCLISTIDTQE